MNNSRTLESLGIYPSTGEPCGAKINDCLRNGQTSLFFSAGEYLIEETLRLPSATHLKLDANARLRLADGVANTEHDYLLANSDPKAGNRDIIIEGGIFDGNQLGNPRPSGLLDRGYTGAMLHFANVRGLRLTGMVLTDAEAYYARFTHVHDFHIEDIGFDSSHVRHNNDGIHLGGNCSHGVIRNIRSLRPGVTGDDLVALNADDALARTEVYGMTNGDISDVVIENLEAQNCHTFVRLLCVFSAIRNVSIRHVRGGCQNSVINADGARGCRVQVFDENKPPYPDGVGLLENILAEDFRVHRTGDNDQALIDIQERIGSLLIRDFVRDRSEDKSPHAPTLRMRHICVKKGTLNGERIEGVDFSGVDARFEDDSDNIELEIGWHR